ncbi:AraC family transcriptional regulator [Chachezhania sediminis]|uniref:AraC family transcriptional regulator n=1 Tax=Chachezhania sediminis TaxID=2599291 RepID=UPI00131E8C67|nr:AraC family transcriptional regulator [Chachezhania sediminis]
MPNSPFLSSHGPSLRAAALAPILRHFGDRQADLDRILRQRGLDPAAVQDPYAVIPLTAYLTVFEDAARLAKDPVLGARLGRRIGPADLGPNGLLMIQSGTMRRGLDRFRRNLASFQNGTESRLVEDGPQAAFSYQLNRPDAVAWPQDAAFSMSCLCHMIRTAFDPRWSPEEIHFIHAPSPRPDVLERLFRAPVRFGQSANRVIFDARALDRVHRAEDTALIAVIKRHVADLILTEDTDTSLSDRVGLVVSRSLGQRPVTLDSVARELGLAPRSLQRHLAAEGTSLRRIVQAHRERIVATQLDTPGTSLKAVAQSLGYSDGTVFWRAYRGWTGHAPSKRTLS